MSLSVHESLWLEEVLVVVLVELSLPIVCCHNRLILLCSSMFSAEVQLVLDRMLAEYPTYSNRGILVMGSVNLIYKNDLYLFLFKFFFNPHKSSQINEELHYKVINSEKNLTGLGVVGGELFPSDVRQQVASLAQYASSSKLSQNSANNPLTHSPWHGRCPLI